MSDDFLLDDELYELATGGDKKRKKRPSEGKSSRKRARTDLGGSDMDDSDEGTDAENPYPFEGKYKSFKEKMELEELPEMERESILAQRLEEMQRIADRHNLSKLMANRGDGGGLADDSVAQAAKRKRNMTNSAREKASTRDALKASRKAREERRAHHTPGTRESPSKRRRSSSSASSDMNMSTDEEEKPRSRKRSENKVEEDNRDITVQDLGRLQLTRTQLAKEYMKPWFEEYVTGAWVRYLIGSNEGKAVYRICEIKSIGSRTVLPYTVENVTMNQQLELAFAKSTRLFNMDKVSNSAFTEREFDRLVATCKQERCPLPKPSHIQEKRQGMKACEARNLTEADVAAMIARRRTINPNEVSFSQRIAEGSRIRQELNAALARSDNAEVTRLRAELDAYNAKYGENDSAYSGSEHEIARRPGIKRENSAAGSGAESLLEELSRRNRQLNHEHARKVQIADAERRRRAHQERLKEEAAKAAAAQKDGSDINVQKMEDVVDKNPDLANKDIGTKMAHMVEIDLPDF